jgi:hypothetical protein
MKYLDIRELRHVIPRYANDVYEPDVSLKYPDIARLRLFATHIEVTGRNGYVQRFRIVWIPTYFGKHRAILVCSTCAGGAIRLFGHYGNYACRFCHQAQYLSQKQKTASRKRLSAAKLRLGRHWLANVWPTTKLEARPHRIASDRVHAAAGAFGAIAESHPHDTPPYPFTPSPTFAHSSRFCCWFGCCLGRWAE